MSDVGICMEETKSHDIRVRSFEFSVTVIGAIESLRRDTSSRIMANQFVRAATSIGANIHEARGTGSRTDFKRFYEISLKSARECEYWLKLLVRTRYMDASNGSIIGDELNQITSVLVSAVKRLKSE